MDIAKLSCKGTLVIFVAALLSACWGGSSDGSASTSLATGEILATIEVYSDTGDSAYASVQLAWAGYTGEADRYPDDRYVRLVEGDELWFTSGVNLREAQLGEDWFKRLSELAHTQRLLTRDVRYRSNNHLFLFWSDVLPTDVHYNAQLHKTLDGATYTVSLLRNRETDALVSTVVMPEAFELLFPREDQTLSRSSDPVQLEWLPVEDDLSIEVNVDTWCDSGIEYQYRTSIAADSGALQIEAGAIDADHLSGSCSTTLTLAKSRFGQLDSAYAGGTISARQVRAVTFTTID